MLDRMKLRLPSLRNEVSRLSGGQRQAIAIGRAVYFDAKILIMDEPTAALGPEETSKVGELIRELKNQGIGIFLISHDIHDVFDLADRLTVLQPRPGRRHGADGGRVEGRRAVDDHPRPDAGALKASGRGPGTMSIAERDTADRRPRPPLASRARRQSRSPAGDDADLSRPRAGGSSAAPRRRGDRRGSSSCRRRGRSPRRSSPSGSRCAFPGSPASSAGSIRCRRRSRKRSPPSRSPAALKGIRPVATNDNRSIAWMLDARFERCWSLMRDARTGARFPRAEPRRGAARHAFRRAASRHADRARPLRQARHCAMAGSSPGRATSPSSRACRTSPASSPGCSIAPRPAPARPNSGLTPITSSALSGRDRLIWASDWPPLELAADYATWRRVSLELLAGLSADEQAAVLGRNAERIYRLTPA